MKIGIVGTSYIGSTLIRKLTGLGHSVYISNRSDSEKLQELSKETGAVSVNAKEAVTIGEIVTITIPQKNVMDLPSNLFEGVSGNVIVIDTGNYYPKLRDGKIAELDGPITDSEWTQKHIGRPVIKVFNSIVFSSLANETIK